MEWNNILTIALAVITITNFALGRKDKSVAEAKSEGGNSKLIEYRLDVIDSNLKEIKNDVKTLVTDIDNKIAKAVENHVKEYHKVPRKKGE